MKTISVPLAILVAVVLLLPGCGGGGPEVALSGTVTDVAGNLVPGADIFLDNRNVTKSLMNGTYKISGLDSGPHNIEAQAFINDELWVGTVAVNVFEDGPTNNMNIVIGRWDRLSRITGVVTDASNVPIPGARVVALARYPQDVPADEASVISKVDVTDANGSYNITDLPASITVNGVRETILYDVIASSAGRSGQPRGFENSTKTATVGDGTFTRLDFSLVSSTDIIPPVPQGWTSPGAIDVISYTVETSIPTRAAQSAYDAVKSCISTRSSKAIAFKNRNITRSAPVGSLIENNVVWYFIWTRTFGFDTPDNLAGFSIYRGDGHRPSQISSDQIDFFRDPAIVTYADTSSTLTPGVTYWYAVSTVSTSYLDANDNFNPLAESDLSAPASVTPLGKMTAVSPADNVSVSAANAVFSWAPTLGARSYRVFVYDAYPIFDSLFTPQGDPKRPDHLPAWGESSVTTGTSVRFSDPQFPLQPGFTYWWVVIASNTTDFDSGNAFAISELRSFVAR